MRTEAVDTHTHIEIVAAESADYRDIEPVIAASMLSRESPEDILTTLQNLPTDTALHIAAHLASGTSSPAEDQADLNAPKGITGTVSQLMVDAFGALSPDLTVAAALDYVVQAHPQKGITYIYVTDENNRLQGAIAMRDLLLASPGQKLSEIMTPEPFSFSETTSIQDAVKSALAQKHRIYPVLDEDDVLVGLVYGWKIFEHVASEVSAQPGSMVGVDREERVSTPILTAFRMRHPWLQVNLLTAFAAAFVVGTFEDTIAKIVVLAVFLPVLAGQSGNTGCQALAITLRSLTLGELANYSVAKLLRKEIILGAMNGFAVGIIAALAMWFYADISGTENPTTLALVILIAMVGACVGSGIFGVLVPLTLRKFGADPAMASSIFLTTFTDILGMGLMLALATMLLM